jgi:hypothetical protein
VETTDRRIKTMTVIRVDNLDQAHDADYTFITLAQIVRADFYVVGHAPNEGYAMVHMSDGNTYRVDGQQALGLEDALKRQGETPPFPYR